MDYRTATEADFPQIVHFINELDYFFPIDPYRLGGTWLIAMDNDKVHGTVWTMVGKDAPHAYCDYWAALSPMVALKLLGYLSIYCEAQHVKYIHGMVWDKNLPAQRLLTNVGCVMAGPYTRVLKEIGS